MHGYGMECRHTCVCVWYTTALSNLIPRYTGFNWISLVQKGGLNLRWEIRVKGDLTPRPDNGRINSSPTTAVPPVLRLRHGVTHTITIPGEVTY